MQGLVYGAVSSQLILLGPAGASLRTGGCLAQLGDPHHNVSAIGGVLAEMLRNADGRESLPIEIGRLTILCQMEAPDMQQVLTTLRLLAMRARHRPAACGPVPPPRPIGEAKKPPFGLHLQTALQWKPLASLAAFALLGK
jgi:hypothetical protein